MIMTYEELTYQILSTELIDRPEKLRKVSKMIAAIMEGIKQPATNDGSADVSVSKSRKKTK